MTETPKNNSKSSTMKPTTAMLILTVMLPTVSFELQNLQHFHLASARQLTMIRPFDILIAIATVSTIACLVSFSVESVFAAIVGYTIAMIVETRFRGAAVRTGTFDQFERSMYPWAQWVWFSLVATVLVMYVVSMRLRFSVTLLKNFKLHILTVILCLIVGIWSWWSTSRLGAGDMSEFAPTKFIPILIFGLIALCCYVSEFFRGEQ